MTAIVVQLVVTGMIAPWITNGVVIWSVTLVSKIRCNSQSLSVSPPTPYFLPSDYEEDFEADDEGPIEDNGEETTRKSASPTNEGKNKDEIQDAPEGEAAEKSKCATGEEAEDADKAGE